MSATYIHTKRDNSLSRLILRILAALYFLALAASIAYVWLLTQDRFVSTAEFRISKQQGTGVDGGLMQLALPGLSDTGSVDSQISIGFIQSADLLVSLEKQFKLIEHYSSPKRDWIFRLEADAPLETRLKYYRSRIFAHLNKETGMTVISVDTFDPSLSRDIAADILKRAEAYVNVINQDIADQQLDFVRSEVERTNKHVEEINDELLLMQNEHNIISPDEVITANLKAVEELRMERFRAEAELSSMLRDSPNSPRIDTVRSRLRSLNELIDVESAKLSGPDKDRLNQILVKYKQLEFRLEFASRLRSGAEAMLERTKVETVARSRFFTVIQHPYLPEDVATPRRPYATASILCLGVMFFFIFRALAHSVFERA